MAPHSPTNNGGNWHATPMQPATNSRLPNRTAQAPTGKPPGITQP